MLDHVAEERIFVAQVDVAEYISVTETSEADYDRVMEINAKGAFLVSRAVAKVMKEQDPKTVTLPRHGTRDLGRGCIVNVASAASHGVVPAKLPYCASKHALLGITRACGTYIPCPLHSTHRQHVC
jgi:NAD(P)-dependent dehydrogenase (short-subunit alcohol dehydrogenase family)